MLTCIFGVRLGGRGDLSASVLLLSATIALVSRTQDVSSTYADRNKQALINNYQQQPGELIDPVNQPLMNQEYARYLSQYMQNMHRDDYWSQLNLAQMNSRAQPPVRIGQHPPTSAEPQAPNRASFMTELVVPPQSSDSIRRDDVLLRKGKVDDVLIFKDHLQATKGGGYPHKNWLRPVAQPFKEKLFYQNCITRATKLVSTCEDHLIRRLNQDAAEGRTVLDVGRRVCCALFWHKDCISSKVVQACPDSSPVAVDYLLGSRKVDLTLSCQRFNRDGCNGANPVSQSAGIIVLQVALLYSMVLVLMNV